MVVVAFVVVVVVVVVAGVVVVVAGVVVVVAFVVVVVVVAGVVVVVVVAGVVVVVAGVVVVVAFVVVVMVVAGMVVVVMVIVVVAGIFEQRLNAFQAMPLPQQISTVGNGDSHGSFLLVEQGASPKQSATHLRFTFFVDMSDKNERVDRGPDA